MHILPYPPSILEESPPDETEILDQVHIQYWRSVLDRLADGSISWDLFLNNFDGPLLSHPAAWLSTTEEGQTLLHLAIIANEVRATLSMAPSSHLKAKRNHFGHTPFELALYLNRTHLASLLQPIQTCSFWQQPHIHFSDPDKQETIAHLEYLSHPIFENYEVMKDVLIRTQKAKLDDEIPTEKVWMGIYYDAEIRKQLNPSVTIRYIDKEVGFGAFAAQRIPSCAFVGEYTGVVEERKPCHLKDKYYCIRYPAWQMGKRKFVIDGEKKGNFTRFINHSNQPNLSLQSVFWKGMSRMIFIAISEISEGSQLTFDYGDIFWKECSQIPKSF